MKCELCEREETEDSKEKLDLRRPGKLQHAETMTAVADREIGHYCKLCRKEEGIYSRKEIFQALKEHGLTDGMNNVRASRLPEKPIQEIVSELEKLSDRKQELEDSYLSEREAELYVLKEKFDLTTSDAAEQMGITVGNARGKLGKIRSKIAKAEKTAELEI